MLGKKISEVICSDLWLSACSNLERALRGERVLAEYEAIFPGVGKRYIETSHTPDIDANGRVCGVMTLSSDVTDRKQAEEELRRTAEELSLINETAPVAIWVARDPSCTSISSNAAGAEFYGSGSKQNCSDCFCEDESVREGSNATKGCAVHDISGRKIPPSELLMQQAARLNKPIRDQMIVVSFPDGSERSLLGSAVPLHDVDGAVRGCVGAFMDVTGLLKAEQALRVSEERLRLVGTTAGIGHWSWDISNEKCHLDAVCAEMFGLHTTPSFEEIYEKIRPTDRARLDRAAQASLEGIAPYVTEYQVTSGDGEPRWLASLGDVVRDEQGRAVMMLGVNIDISDRKRIEEERQKFVSLAEQSPEFVGLVDLEFSPTFFNAAALRVLGLYDLEDAKNFEVQDFFFPEDRGYMLEEFFPHVMREQQGEIEVRLRHVRGGAFRWMLCNCFTVRNSEGVAVGFALVSRDITDRRRTEQLLHESDRRKDEFLAILAHELRNPLAPISNALQIWPLLERNPEKAAETRALMGRQVRQLQRLIDDLLDVSRISRGKIALRKKPVDVSLVLSQAVDAVQGLLEASKHKLVVDLPKEPLFVEGDEGRLAQIFDNLLNNAAKYTMPQGLLSASVCSERDSVVMRVKDNGIGIPPEMLSYIFEPFAQVNQSLDRSQGGLGIGLTLVKTLVELHGGVVSASSDGVGHGCEFTVRLPALTRGAVETTVADDIDCELGVLQPGVHHRVLVVDDLRASGDTLASMLEELGQETRVVYDGFSALGAIRDFKPSLIISDIAMPGVDGYHLAHRVRATYGKSLTMIALTGYGQEHDKARAYAAGFDGHLVKPTTLDALAHVLRKAPVQQCAAAPAQ
jgi:PAS domain S-box-containing protein